MAKRFEPGTDVIFAQDEVPYPAKVSLNYAKLDGSFLSMIPTTLEKNGFVVVQFPKKGKVPPNMNKLLQRLPIDGNLTNKATGKTGADLPVDVERRRRLG